MAAAALPHRASGLAELPALRDAFLSFEEDEGLWDERADGQHYWHLVRANVWNDVLRERGLLAAAHPRLTELPLSHWLKPRLRLWPTWARRALRPGLQPADLLVVTHARKLLRAGHWVCPYTQPLLDALDSGGAGPSRWLVDSQFRGGYAHPQPDERICTVELPWLIAHARYALRELTGGGVDARDCARIEGLRAALERELGAAPGAAALRRRVRGAVLASLGLARAFGDLLDRVRPKALLMVVSYDVANLVLARAARARAIPVLELQHGLIGREHIAYNFAAGRRPEAFPDSLLLFGRYWAELAEGLPLPPAQLPPLGFAWLEDQLAKYPQRAREDAQRVLFLSQGAIADDLARLAAALRRRVEPARARITYRLHPSESPLAHRDLARAGVALQDPRAVALHEALADADLQVGVYSTALFEGMARGLRTAALSRAGAEPLSPLVAEGAAAWVDDACELEALLEGDGARASAEQIERVWQPGARDSFRALIDDCLGS